jgi:hypothetical protein
MEWVALAFLGLLAARRLRGRDATSRPARHSPPVGQRAGRARPI